MRNAYVAMYRAILGSMLPLTVLALLCLAGAGVASERGPNQSSAEPNMPEDNKSSQQNEGNLWVSSAPSALKTRSVSRRLIIILETSPDEKKGEVNSMTINALAGISSLANVKSVKGISPRAGIHLVTLSRAKEAENTIRDLENTDRVESVEFDHLLHISDANPDDPYFRNGNLWGIQKINAPSAWAAVGTGSKDVIVCVIDSGVDYNHPDLVDNMWRNPGETGFDSQGRNKATNGIDDDGNGIIDGEF